MVRVCKKNKQAEQAKCELRGWMGGEHIHLPFSPTPSASFVANHFVLSPTMRACSHVSVRYIMVRSHRNSFFN